MSRQGTEKIVKLGWASGWIRLHPLPSFIFLFLGQARTAPYFVIINIHENVDHLIVSMCVV